MSRICLKIKLELLEDLLFSSGHGIYGIFQTEPKLDRDGRPFMPGSTLKGLLRESIENYLCWTGITDSRPLDRLFARRGTTDNNAQSRLIFSHLKLDSACTDWRVDRKRLSLKDGVAANSISISCVAAGTCFYGTLICDESDLSLVEKGLQGIHWAGTMRARGLGRVRFSICETSPLPQSHTVPQSHWLRYRLLVDTTMILRSGDSHSGRKHIRGRNYLPGSSVRGMVMGALSQQQPELFRNLMPTLLSDVHFGSAFPVVHGKELIPTPKGFYADKQQTCFYSVLDEDVRSGHKRAELGSFCYVAENTLHHFSPAMEQSVRISKEGGGASIKQGIASGTELVGYIYLHDPDLAPLVASAFSDRLCFGREKYAGNGQCALLSLDTQAPAYFGYGYGPEDPVDKELYMLLLSGCTMSRHGDSGGIDLRALAELLEVPQVVIRRCATSVAKNSSFNTTWKACTPTAVVYSPGSMFKLSFPQGVPTWQALLRLQERGLGLHTAEGLGQVLFFKDFPDIRQAMPVQSIRKSQQNAARWRSVRSAWLLDTPLPGTASGSDLDQLQTLCQKLIAGEKQAMENLHSILNGLDSLHLGKRVRRQETFSAILPILEQPIGQTLDCPDYPDSPEERIRLLNDWILVNRRKGY